MGNTDLIAYCGLYCAECFSYKGSVADLARDLRKELRNYRFEKTAGFLAEIPFFKDFKNYDQCYSTLGAMVRMRCNKGCKGGSGNPSCKIKLCCQKKQLDGCWQCDEFKSCKKLDFLRQGHGEAHLKNLGILSRKGVEHFLAGKKHWYVKERKK